MTAYADTAIALVLPTEHTPGSEQTLAEALHDALANQAFKHVVLSAQEQRDVQTPAAVAFGLAVKRGSQILRLAECADVVEAEGLQLRIDHYAIRAACRFLAGKDTVARVTVKASAETLAQQGCAHLVEDAATSAGIDLNQLELEIEEHALHWRGDIEPTLRHLSKLGVRIAIDRFGTGLTSLSALSHLPITTIKIDESIVSTVLADSDVANYARAIIDVARHMHIDVVAVGVSTPEQQAFFEGAGSVAFQI